MRHGVSEPPVPGVAVDTKTYRQRYEELLHRIGMPFWPDAAWKDVVFALAVGAVVLLLAIVFGPPELGTQADPTERAGLPAAGLVLPVVLRALALRAAAARETASSSACRCWSASC